MLDTYWWGNIERISPEAPVPVVDVQQVEHRPGGAANVAMNLQALGAKTILCSVIGNDEQALLLKNALASKSLSTSWLTQSESRKTTQKNRVLSKNRQVLRFDVESKTDLSAEEFQQFSVKLKSVLDTQPVNVIVLQDYNKGVLSKSVIDFVLAEARERNIPVAVDPKQKNFFEYRGVDLFKPNLKETSEALQMNIDKENIASVATAAQSLAEKISAENILMTLSEKGAYGWSKGSGFHIAAHERNITDVSGAGDTVIAVAALCISQQLHFELTARLSNIAGGLVCEASGVVPISKSRLLEQAQALLS